MQVGKAKIAMAIGSMTAAVRSTIVTVYRAVYHTDPTRQWILFITASMDDHDEESKTEFIYTQQ